MTYAYSYQTNSIDKYASIQEDVADQYAYLDEEVDVDEDDVPNDELTDEQVDALLADMEWVA
jgi:hypothetical protein